MYLQPWQMIVMILAIAAGTILTRFTSFILFPEKKNPPAFITYLGKMLPAAMMGLLIVYCFRNVSLVKTPHGIPELVCVSVVVLLQLWKGKPLLSIGAGTVLYMFLIQNIFA